jgi:ribosomal protein S18 acetylase RimI-like enzyme
MAKLSVRFALGGISRSTREYDWFMTGIDFQPLVVEGEPNPTDLQALREGMLAHHAESGHPREQATLSIFLRDSSGEPFGGVIASTLWGRMQIQSLWVHESIRGQGWGRKLMEAAEKEAVRRGCTDADTATFSWQAPDFYRRLGYEVYGVLEDYPPGNSLTYFTKELS